MNLTAKCNLKPLAAMILFSSTTALAQVTFTKDSTSAVAMDGNSHGSSWGDYDNDGDPDLFVLNDAGCFFYVNNGAGSFTRINDIEVVSDGRSGGSGSWGDYDNDGYIDLYVSYDETDFLYHNKGDGSFLQINGDLSGLGDEGSSGTAWADYNNDGHLDLFVANSVTSNILFENNGGPPGSWLQERSDPIYRDNGGSVGVSWADYDNDGDLDLFVANHIAGGVGMKSGQKNFLYGNNGDGSFDPILTGPIVEDILVSIGGSWGDYDNDGDLDLFVANETSSNNLYRNEGGGLFTKITEGPVVTGAASSFGSNWADYDNDGDLDLFVANNGSRNFLYQNDGDTDGTGKVTFTPIDGGDIANESWSSRGVSSADIDNDGDLDVFVANVGLGQPNILYLNDGIGGNWINIRCIGTFSNRSAIGTKVRIKATVFGRPVKQMREISAQTGFYAQNSLRVSFGLGDATVIDSVEVEWPSGRNQILTSVGVNEFRTITELIPLVVEEPSTAELGNEYEVVATDNSGTIVEVTLEYRSTGEDMWTETSMSSAGSGSFRGAIPGADVTANGVEYRVVATDNVGLSVRLPIKKSFTSVRVHSPTGLSANQPQPYGSAQTSYRIFSVPLALDDASPAALLVDDLGEYDVTRWRFSEYVTENNTYFEFPEILAIEPGKGYWFLVSEPARVIDTGAGTSMATDESFAIGLTPGWNLIGNPFNFPIPVSNLRLNGGNSVVLRSYNGAWNNPISGATAEIVPFEGYAINNIELTNDTLFINPTSGSGSASQTNKKSIKAIPWSINILARSQNAQDVDNVLGVNGSASAGWDEMDYPEPPPVGEYVSVYFLREELGARSHVFSTDFRPLFDAITTWEFEVKSNIRDQVRLTFAGIETVPREFEVWLVDEDLSLTQNLRKENQFYLASPGIENPKRLKLLVGQTEFMGNELINVQQVPSNYELSQNFPNPFNPLTTIRYGLPNPDRVTLRVYDVMGREIASVIDDEHRAAGYHVAIWDGRNNDGEAVASGVYFVKIQTGEFAKTRKMILID